MASPGKTKKPCEGCGETQPYGRETGKVCAACQRLIDEARQARRAAVRRANSGLEAFPRPWAAHTLGYIHRAGGESGRVFQETFYKLLLRLLAEPAPPNLWPAYGAVQARVIALGLRDHEDRSDTWSSHDDGCGLIDPALLEAAGAVYKAARQIAQAAYDDGKAAGSRLLFGLAAGEVTIADLNSYEAERSATVRARSEATGGFEARCRRCRGYAVVETHDGLVEITCRGCGAHLGAEQEDE